MRAVPSSQIAGRSCCARGDDVLGAHHGGRLAAVSVVGAVRLEARLALTSRRGRRTPARPSEYPSCSTRRRASGCAGRTASASGPPVVAARGAGEGASVTRRRGRASIGISGGGVRHAWTEARRDDHAAAAELERTSRTRVKRARGGGSGLNARRARAGRGAEEKRSKDGTRSPQTKGERGAPHSAHSGDSTMHGGRPPRGVRDPPLRPDDRSDVARHRKPCSPRPLNRLRTTSDIVAAPREIRRATDREATSRGTVAPAGGLSDVVRATDHRASSRRGRSRAI
jgi:hypothetical protein